jgi:hypothetical protein
MSFVVRECHVVELCLENMMVFDNLLGRNVEQAEAFVPVVLYKYVL